MGPVEAQCGSPVRRNPTGTTGGARRSPIPRACSEGSPTDCVHRSDRTVAEEYFKVTKAVEAGTGRTEALAPDVGGPNMAKLAADHRRHLGNGHCTRPRDLDCGFETAYERCGFFETGPQFVTILLSLRGILVQHRAITRPT
jgi:hypothetical protein